MAIFWQLLVVCVLLVCDTKATSSVCSQPRKTGPCRARFPMYFFNKDSQQCEWFAYGGCRGNSNRFRYLKTCESTCGKPCLCSLPEKVGYCRAQILRYFFNKKAGECQKFYYGGCMGNANNFISMEECQSMCGADICSLPKKVGRCRARISRYYFNKTAGKCHQFYYGGCMGNENNFKSLEECQCRCNN